MTSPIPVYLDCDPGIDDALALAYLLASPKVEIVGIGTVSGNTSAAQAARNTLDLLSLAGVETVPVAVGAHDHLDHPYDGGAPDVHGENGLGDVAVPRSDREPDARSAVELLLDLSREYEGRLHVLAIGPLTNIAHALAADPALPERVAAVTVMGGAALVSGNITPAAEANIYNDPQAAAATLAADWDLTLVPLDVTMEHTLDDDQRRMLLADARPFVAAVGAILDHYLDFYVDTYGHRTCALHDPLAAVLAAGAVAPTRAPRVPVEVDVSHGPGRGQTIADLRWQRTGTRDHDDARARVVLEVESSISAHLLETILAG